MALIQAGKLSVASLGDSVCLLIRKDNTFKKLSVDHTTQRDDECKRVQRNGFIVKGMVNGELAVSRAIGNSEHKSVIISDPETTQV